MASCCHGTTARFRAKTYQCSVLNERDRPLAQVSVADKTRLYARACFALRPPNFSVVIKQRLGKLLRFGTHRMLFLNCWESRLLGVAASSSRYNHSSADAIALAFEIQLAARRVGKFRLDMTISLFRNEDLA